MATPDDVVVGVDFGSSRIKAAAYTAQGTMAALAALPTPRVSTPVGLDFPVLALIDAAERAIATLQLPTGSITAVGIGAMGEVGTLLRGDRLAELSFPAWYDDRGAPIIAAINSEFGRERLAGLTGGHVRATSTMAKLGHLASLGHCPDGVFLGLAGALAWRLTGEIGQENGLASTCGAYDPVRRRLLPQVWSAAGLDRVRLAPVLPPGHGLPARGEVARRLGLAPGAPVVIAGHDHPVAALGTGARPGDVVNSIGTSEGALATLAADAPRGPGAIGHLVQAGFTVESWPASTDPLVMSEGLRPGLAMDTFLRATGGDRAELDRLAPPTTATTTARIPRLDRAMSLAMEAGENRLPPGPRSWAALLDHYAEQAARGEQALRAATGAQGQTILTGGGLRSRRWLAAKLALSPTDPVICPVRETVTRGAAALAGAGIGWWPQASDMPGIA